MLKFHLSQGISILHPDEYPGNGTPSQYLQGHYILQHRHWGKSFLINDTVKYFIDKFYLPQTLTEVVTQIAQELQTDTAVIRKKCAAFFSFLCKRGIVVPEICQELSPSEAASLQAGDLVGPFEIADILFNKKHRDIYLVRDSRDGKQYVLKLLNQQKIASDQIYQEELLHLQHEYEMLQKVKHIPFMCRAFHFNTREPAGAFIQLEYIKGKLLPQYLEQAAGLSRQTCLSIMKDLLSTFAALHESKLIHGDIHPANILVAEDHQVKIIDLGLSLPVDIDEREVITFGGVLHFMPPERINACSFNKFSKEPDFYSDVYQIGLILYFILYLKAPFSGFIWKELSANIKHSKISFPKLAVAGFQVPGELMRIISKCTRKSRGKRYATATAVLEAFQLAFGPALEISPPSIS